MTNPSPRPALRKAADAEVHPAAPQPARSPRSRRDAVVVSPVPAPAPGPAAAAAAPAAVEPAPTPPKAPKKRHPETARPAKPAKRKFSGATSDHLRVPEVPEAGNGSAQRSALDALFDGDTAATPAREATADRPKKAKRPKTSAPADLMGGKPVDLGATVPKALRKAVREEAKRRGLDVDAVVTDLLHAWVTGRP